MYIGNLESYQGIDLLLEGFSKAIHTSEELTLVIVGGEIEDIEKYRSKSVQLGVGNKVYFLGKQPVSDLYALMRQADILVSPRTQGINTPMKVYSYLDSNIPVLATRLPTHTQVMTDEHACLVEASAAGIAEGIDILVKNPELCQRLAKNARDLIEAEHSFSAFHEKVQQIYTLI
jgi:glycosyltransferase involved in cell wall biosynthesis